VITSGPVKLISGVPSPPVAAQLQIDGVRVSLPLPVTITISSRSTGGALATDPGRRLVADSDASVGEPACESRADNELPVAPAGITASFVDRARERANRELRHAAGRHRRAEAGAASRSTRSGCRVRLPDDGHG
jgi:hypothetical protein